MPILIMILVIAALVAAAVLTSRYLVRKAVRNVVALFRERGATSPKSATTAEELGLVKAGLIDGMFKVRDYRPDALRLLGQANIIKMTAEGKLYLSEEELADSRVREIARID